MSSSDEGGSSSSTPHQKKYKGVRRRKWGKWVSEIRVPGTQERLWLGSYSTPEAAAVAHDIASYCLRGVPENLNFPLTLPAGVRMGMSPQSIQKAASDAGMAVDAQFAIKQESIDSSSTVANNEMKPLMNSDQSMNQRTMLIQDDHFGVNWDGSELMMRQGKEDLNISVEDYLFC